MRVVSCLELTAKLPHSSSFFTIKLKDHFVYKRFIRLSLSLQINVKQTEIVKSSLPAKPAL